MAAHVIFMRGLRTASKPSFGASTCHSSPSIQSYLPNNSTTAGILNNVFSPSILSRAPVSNLYTSAAQAYRHADHSRSSHYHSLSLSSALSSPPGSFRRGVSSSVFSSVSSSSSISTGAVTGTLPAAKGRDYGQDTSFIDTTKVWVQLYEQEKGCTPILVEGMHAFSATLPSSSDVEKLLKYLVAEELKDELDGIAATRLMLYHRAEDGKLQEWKDYSTNLKELQRQTQSNGVRPLCVVKPLCRSIEPEFPISVTFEFVYGDNQARVEGWIRSRKEISLAYFQKLAFTSTIKFPESIAETDLSFDVGDMGETTVSLCTNEDVQRNIWSKLSRDNFQTGNSQTSWHLICDTINAYTSISVVVKYFRSSILYVTFYLLYGRDAKLPIDMIYGAQANEAAADDFGVYKTRLAFDLRRAHQIVKSTITAVGDQFKKR
ncbi:hypothetical protein SeMB42_g07449 [Synchytrium endobioticum]|uniref:Uncharacterized protein n=1 Tax=Synchytrium endobioticum TaxID=286115 RepID=A0A507C6F8_9FUNG|nr:hypothetical protein SeMB42_g07449 [Synchytrium endobioticum]